MRGGGSPTATLVRTILQLGAILGRSGPGCARWGRPSAWQPTGELSVRDWDGGRAALGDGERVMGQSSSLGRRSPSGWPADPSDGPAHGVFGTYRRGWRSFGNGGLARSASPVLSTGPRGPRIAQTEAHSFSAAPAP